MEDTIYVKGLSKIGEVLQTLPDNFREKVVRGSTSAAAAEGQFGVQTEAPFRTGNLYRNIRIAKRPDPSKDQVLYVVYVRTGGKRQRGGSIKRGGLHGPSAPSQKTLPYYWFFVEFGTTKMAANPFMLRGFLKSAEPATKRARDVAEFLLVDLRLL